MRVDIVWRDATRADQAAIARLWTKQQAQLATLAPTIATPQPELFQPEDATGPCGIFRPPVLRVRVACRAEEVVACRIVEAVCEVQLVGGDQEVVASLARELPEECAWARARGFRSGWGLAPRVLARAVARALRHTPLRRWPSLELIGCDFAELGD